MKKFSIVCAILLVFPCIAFAGILPDTGQTKCYDNYEEISCPQPGEDFYGQDAQYAPCNPQSYTKLDAHGNDLPDDAPWPWVMVRDNVTGLIWAVKTDDDSMHDKDNMYKWYDAQDVFIATLNSQHFGGHSDWRLPTPQELASITNRDNYSPAINTTYFPNTMSSDYWSSTTDTEFPSAAWFVDFDFGTVNYQVKSHFFYVRAVHGEQRGSFGNFIDNGDGTVTDTDTGLMWQQDATSHFSTPWQAPLSYCENLVLAGYDDWRLPDINELQSIVDYSQYEPSINTTYFPDTRGYYWSSTTNPDDQHSAFAISFEDGFIGSSFLKTYFDLFVRAVRAGQCESFADSDSDGIPDDGDNSGISGDNPCTGGQTTQCDDNCPDVDNEDQADSDSDGIGDLCDTGETAIPTLSEWGIIIFMTILMAIGVVSLFRRRRV